MTSKCKYVRIFQVKKTNFIRSYFCFSFEQESDTALSIIGVITNAVDHLFYPVEKICWLAEHRCLTVEDPDRWDTISSILWVSSIYLNLMRYTNWLFSSLFSFNFNRFMLFLVELVGQSF